MRTIALGSTGNQVSALCLGAMYLGGREDEAISDRLLERYLEAGGRFIDTANIYAHWEAGGRGGESEAYLGRWLKRRGRREDVFIASKVGFEYPGVARGLSAATIIAECEKSLRRLGIETIDLYYAHVDDRATPQEETLAAFERLAREGKVRFIGASNFRAWRLEEAARLSEEHGWPRYQCVQQRYTYLQPRAGSSFSPQLAANDDLLDYCATHPVTPLAYSPLLSGAYTRPDRPLEPQYHSEDNHARLEALRAVADECGATPNQVVLAWLLQSDPPVIPVFGASSLAQMDENLAALDVRLSPEQMQRLNQAPWAGKRALTFQRD